METFLHHWKNWILRRNTKGSESIGGPSSKAAMMCWHVVCWREVRDGRARNQIKLCSSKAAISIGHGYKMFCFCFPFLFRFQARLGQNFPQGVEIKGHARASTLQRVILMSSKDVSTSCGKFSTLGCATLYVSIGWNNEYRLLLRSLLCPSLC